MANDLCFALRRLRQAPGFTVAALVTLALGIGANTAIFTLVDTLLLRALPVRDPQSLVLLARVNQRGEFSYDLSYPLYRDLRDSGAFDGALAVTWNGANFSEGEAVAPERITVELVSGNYFEFLGLEPAAGRLLTPEDDRHPSGHPLAVLGYNFWQRRYGGDRSVIGRTIRLNGLPFTVVGVTPKRFGSLNNSLPEVRVPIMMQPTLARRQSPFEERRSSWLFVVGRVPPGSTLEKASAKANSVYQLALEVMGFPAEQRPKTRLDLQPAAGGFPFLRQQFSQPLLVLMGITGLLLLIACANIAGLLLARAAARRKEMGVRLALGAGRWRLIRPLLIESLLLGVGGAALGIGLAFNLLPILAPLLPAGGAPNLAPDARVLVFAALATLVSAVLFGLLPAWLAARVDIATSLKGAVGFTGSGGGFRLRKILVAGQVAVSVLLLIGAGLFVRTLRNLRSTDLGFERENVVLASFFPTLNGYTPPMMRAFYQNLRERVERLPNVRSASWGAVRMMAGGGMRRSSAVEGYQPHPDEDMQLNINAVDERYFETMGMSLLRGRGFTPQDREGTPPVAIVNETMARYFFGTVEAVGKRLGWDQPGNQIEIVGVVKDTKFRALRESTWRTVYLPITPNTLGNMNLHVRVTENPVGLIAALRCEAQALDPNLPMVAVRTMEEQVAEAMRQERLMALLAGFFSALAAVLAAVGLYGVMAHAVALRTREMGIRMALGAQRAHVIGLVLRDSGILVAAGVVAGIPAALWLGRLVSKLLYGVEPADPAAMLGSAAFLALVALPAAWLPARRASRVEPAISLRQE